jgi:hypothetical protein
LTRPILARVQSYKIADPFTGTIIVENSEAEIESIDLQLTRVETCGNAEAAGQAAKEATEIQSLQLVHGDPCRGLPIHIYMVFPRLFTCPTVTVRTFKVQFEVRRSRRRRSSSTWAQQRASPVQLGFRGRC